MYKEVSRLGLRFRTPKGNLNVEQLWNLSFKDLTSSIKEANKLLNENKIEDELSFLEVNGSTTDSTHQLIFNVLKDVYVTKRAEKDALNEVSANKEHNEKIMALIKEKEDESLKGKTKEELEALLIK